MKFITLLIAAMACVGARATWAQASEFAAHEARWTGPGSLQNGYYGRTVSLSGDTLAVGMPGASGAGIEYGRVEVWVLVGGSWQLQAQLQPSDLATGDQLSFVALQGDTLAVGSQYHHVQGLGTGAVYVYQRSAGVWSLQAELSPPNGANGQLFGCSVALDGSKVLVGARGSNSYTGAAYVFAQAGGSWSYEAELLAPDGQGSDDFGTRVCLRGSHAVVGSPGDDGTQGDEGSAYVFESSGAQWSYSAKLTASDASGSDHFGFGIDLSGDTLAIGAWRAGASPSYEPGAVYLFDHSSGAWAETAKLQPTGLSAFAQFGVSVSLSADRLVVGAPAAGGYVSSGAVYFFQHMGGSWIQRQRIWPQGGSSNINFGEHVSLDGDHLAIGAPLDGQNPINQGSVHVYRTSADFDSLCFGDGSGAACPCGNTTLAGFGMGCANSIARGGRLLVEGQPSVGADSVLLHGSDMPQGSALYFQGSAAINIGTGVPLMDGLLCIGGSPVRLGVKSVPGQGESAYPTFGVDPPVSVRGSVAPGDVRYYQVYYRDTATFCTAAPANFSNAIRIVWQP